MNGSIIFIHSVGIRNVFVNHILYHLYILRLMIFGFVRFRRFVNFLPVRVMFVDWILKIVKSLFSKYILPWFLSFELGLIDNGAMSL